MALIKRLIGKIFSFYKSPQSKLAKKSNRLWQLGNPIKRRKKNRFREMNVNGRKKLECSLKTNPDFLELIFSHSESMHFSFTKKSKINSSFNSAFAFQSCLFDILLCLQIDFKFYKTSMKFYRNFSITNNSWQLSVSS